MGKILIERIKYWAQLLLLPMYCISFLIPRNKYIWVFGSTFGKRFADNPRYFYLYLAQHKSDIRAVWISHDKEIVELLCKNGYKAYYNHSLVGIWYCLRAKVYVYDNYPKDISHWLSGGATKVNLWHGIALKKIQNDNLKDKVRNPRNFIEKLHAIPRRLSDEKPSHYVLSPSKMYSFIFESAFKTNKIIINGYPRCDFLKTKEINNLLTDAEQYFYDLLLKEYDKKIILYMPTFRESEMKFFETIEIESFKKYLRNNNYLFCVKLHCKSKLNEFFKGYAGENIVVIDSKADPYCYLSFADILVTDYSSIYLDYLYLNKPVVFFTYDYEDYIHNSREMYFSYDEFVSGYRVEKQEELEEIMQFLIKAEGKDGYEGEREELKKRVFAEEEQTSSECLYKHIMKILE